MKNRLGSTTLLGKVIEFMCRAHKNEWKLTFCVDYRRLNDVTWKHAYPLPRIDHSLDALDGSQLFSTLD